MTRVYGMALTFVFAAVGLAACGGGTTTGNIPSLGSSGGSGGSGGNGSRGSGGGSSPTTAPHATATPAGSPTGSATTPPGSSSLPPPTPPPPAPSYTNLVPAVPAGTACRAGQTYNIGVTSGPTDISPAGSTEVFTVFEPSPICGGQTYPLIFNGPGFGSSRTSAAGSFPQFTNAGYGVISVDEAGEGNDGGKIRVMDPDQEGVMLLAVMNWAQATLPWLAYGPTNDGTDPHEPIFGSEGGSYGGMYQFMLLNVDKRHRLRAIVPQITPANLNFALFPGGIVKTLWDAELFAIGQTAGNGTNRAQYDPFVNETFVSDDVANQEDAYAHDFFGYHSADYFCNGTPIATNGGAGTAPWLPPTTAPPKINALIWIGVRDTLFDYNNGYHNYKCMQGGGGDVRLLSYQTGHNAQLESGVNGVGTVPDPYVALYYPNNDSLDSRCGTLAEATAELAWFNRYLKGQTGALSGIPTNPCISFESGDGITLPVVPTYTSGPAETPFDIGSVNVVSGAQLDLPTAVSLYTAPSSGSVEAGIPHIVVDVSSTVGLSLGTPMVFVGIGQLHASNPAAWDLVDNQVMPLRGIGHYDIDLIGGGARLQPGDKLGVLFFGLEDQFAANGNISVADPAIEPLTITGKVYLPILGPMPSNV
jgi:ABC-2 type transport system ATP-binding protein